MLLMLNNLQTHLLYNKGHGTDTFTELSLGMCYVYSTEAWIFCVNVVQLCYINKQWTLTTLSTHV